MKPYECKYCLMPRRIDNHQCETHRLQSHIDDLYAQISDFEEAVENHQMIDDAAEPGLVSDDPYRFQQPPEK